MRHEKLLRALAVVVAAATIGFGADARAEASRQRASTGPALSFGFGANFCIERDEPFCEELGPDVGFTASFLWRFIPYLAAEIGLDFGFAHVGNVDEDEEADFFSGAFLIGPRGYIPIGPVDINVGLMIGYARARGTISYDDIWRRSESHWVQGFVLGLSNGVDIWLGSYFEAGLRWQLLFPFFSESCWEYEEDGYDESDCSDIDTDSYPPSDQIPFELRVSVHMTVYFAPHRFGPNRNR